MFISHKRYPVFFLFFLLILASVPGLGAKTYDLYSPDKKIRVSIQVGSEVSYSVFVDGRELVVPSPMSLTPEGAGALGKNPRLSGIKMRSVENLFSPVVKEKRAEVVNRFNEAVLDFRGNYGLIFRAYNDGVAYRFLTRFKDTIKVVSEEVRFTFAEDHSIFIPFVESFLSSYERNYSHVPLSQITAEKMAFLPVLVDVKNGPKIAITESDLDDYPGLYVKGSADGSPSLFGLFPAYPLKEEQRRDRTLEVKERADYIAQTKGTRTFPWRALLIARRDADLIESDFVSKYGIEYIILDEGWSDPADLFKVNATIDMPQLLAYAREKNVGIILWCVWLTLDRQLQEALDLFERWGVKGIKVDFMDRDDQKVVNFYRRVAAAAAQRRLEFDFLGEGAWKAEIYADGVNASKYASDYKKTTMAVKPGDIVKIKLAPGGGWAARLFK